MTYGPGPLYVVGGDDILGYSDPAHCGMHSETPELCLASVTPGGVTYGSVRTSGYVGRGGLYGQG